MTQVIGGRFEGSTESSPAVCINTDGPAAPLVRRAAERMLLASI